MKMSDETSASHSLPGRRWYLVALSGMVWSWSWSWSWSWQDWVVRTLKKKKKLSIHLWDTTPLKWNILLPQNILLFKNSLALCERNENMLHYAKNSDTGESWGSLCLVRHSFTRCRNKYINSRVMRQTPGCYVREELGFDFTPMFTAIQISF